MVTEAAEAMLFREAEEDAFPKRLVDDFCRFTTSRRRFGCVAVVAIVVPVVAAVSDPTNFGEEEDEGIGKDGFFLRADLA